MEDHSDSVDEPNGNEIEYKGNFDNENDDDELEFYEFGAHFPYKGLYNKLDELVKSDPNLNDEKSHSIEKHQILKIKNVSLFQNSHQSRNINVYFSNNKNEKKNYNHIANNDKNLLSLGTNTNKNNISKNLAISSLTIVDKSKVLVNHKKDKNNHKNLISKHPVKTTAKINLNEHIKKTSRDANSLSVSKKKNIKSISENKNNKKEIQVSNRKIPNSNPKKKQHLSCSYQNLNLKKISSPQKIINTNNNKGISNIKYIKITSKTKQKSPKPKIISKSNPSLNTNTTQKTSNKPSSVGQSKTKNVKSRNPAMKIQQIKEEKKENTLSAKQSQTFHKSNTKIQEVKDNHKLVVPVSKQKPHSQDKPKILNNISNVHQLKREILKKSQPSKPLSANIASASSLKSPNNKKQNTNANSHINLNLSHPKSKVEIKVQIVKKENSFSQAKHQIKKNISNNIAVVQIPLQPPSSASLNSKKTSSRNNRSSTNTKQSVNNKTHNQNFRFQNSKNNLSIKNKITSATICNSTNKKIKQIDSSKLKTKCNSSISNGSKKNNQVSNHSNIKNEILKI